MKNLLFIVSFFLISSCRTVKNQSFPNAIGNCELLQSILYHKDIGWITGLDSAKDVRPSIRIFDLSRKFKNCQSLFKSKNFDFSIPYHVEENIRPSINTGIYRDIVIHRFSFDKYTNIGDLIISAATFKTHNNVNTNFRIALKYKIVNSGTIHFIDSKIMDYIDPPPDFDYDKY